MLSPGMISDRYIITSGNEARRQGTMEGIVQSWNRWLLGSVSYHSFVDWCSALQNPVMWFRRPSDIPFWPKQMQADCTWENWLRTERKTFLFCLYDPCFICMVIIFPGVFPLSFPFVYCQSRYKDSQAQHTYEDKLSMSWISPDSRSLAVVIDV